MIQEIWQTHVTKWCPPFSMQATEADVTILCPPFICRRLKSDVTNDHVSWSRQRWQDDEAIVPLSKKEVTNTNNSGYRNILAYRTADAHLFWHDKTAACLHVLEGAHCTRLLWLRKQAGPIEEGGRNDHRVHRSRDEIGWGYPHSHCNFVRDCK